jgi:UDP-N-acetylmuramoylalanine--D-glutamate ligase
VLSPGLKLHHEPLRSRLAACAAGGAEIIGELELAARHCPAPMIAVTGTKGKSTTTQLIRELLEACGIAAVRAGNSGVPLIAELANLSPNSWAIVEVSSFQLETATTLKPRIAALLNLLPDHQDYHPSLQQYWETKLKLFRHQNADDIAVFNSDDVNIQRWQRGELNLQPAWPQLKALKLLTSGSSAGNDDSRLWIARRDNALGLLADGGFSPLLEIADIPLRGAHNVGNVAVALAVVEAVLAAGDIAAAAVRPQLRDALRAFQSLPHRLERVGEYGGLTFVNDSQATIPDATIAALCSFAPPLTLIAGGLDKLAQPGAFDALGQAIADHAQLFISIGTAAPVLEAAARRAGFAASQIVSAGDLTTAVEEAKIRTPRGGTILLSPDCASFDQFKSFEERGDKFRAAARTLGGAPP